MDELKEAITYLLNTTKAKSATELFQELIPIFYASAFSDGQNYMLDRTEEEKDEDKKKEEGERGRGGKEGETFLHLNSTAKLYNVELIFNFVVRVL